MPYFNNLRDRSNYQKLVASIKIKYRRPIRTILLFIDNHKYFTLLSRTQEKTIIICFDGKVLNMRFSRLVKGDYFPLFITQILVCEFEIYFKSPFPLENVLALNVINWITDESG